MLYRNFSTQEELDAQYNVRAAVPDFPRYAELYEQESRKAREEELERRLDVPFGPTLAESLDVFPAARERAPVLIYFHGGYWHSLSKEMFSFVARGPVSAGVAMVVDYTLCPKVSVAEIVRQARAAVAWTYRNADGFGGDPERLFVAGHSAGGHLAAMAALTDWGGTTGCPRTPSRAVPDTGLFDLRPFPYTYLQPKLQLTWGEVLSLSLLLNLPEEAPPLLVSYGEEETDELRHQSEDFLGTWREQGLPGELLPQPGKHHF